MKTTALLSLLAAIATTQAMAEGPIDTAANVAHGAVDTARNVTHSVVRGTKKAVHRVADALTPESDATAVNVTMTDHAVDVHGRVRAGKTAFVVHNSGHHTHNFIVDGDTGQYEFAHAVRPGQTKVLHVPLERGTYSVRSTGTNSKSATVVVR